nr:hypothetical protein [Tanacetum cinerariifolium]
MKLRKKVVLSPAKLSTQTAKKTDGTDEKVESEKEVKEENEGETKEEEEDDPKNFDTFPTMKELRYHEWLLKNPRPSWVKAKIRTRNVNNVKFSCMIGQFNKEQAYLDLESPINVMSMLHYNWIMVIDTSSVIDHCLGSVVFEKLFVEATRLVDNKEEGTVIFERDKEKIVFKMPYKMDMFKHIDFADISTNRIPPFIIESDGDNCEKIHYLDIVDLGPEYKYDEYVCIGIRSLMAAKARRMSKGEVT